MIFGQKKINEAVELERQQAQEVLQDVHATVANLEVSIDGVTEKIGHVSDETANISSVMQEFTASMEEMSSNINELSDTMGEMDEAFQQMSEEACAAVLERGTEGPLPGCLPPCAGGRHGPALCG